MWQQVRQPNLDPIIYQPNGKGGSYPLTDWYGWCLAFVQTAFSSGWAGSNAWEAWSDHVVAKHGDMNLPGGVFVPIWFSGYGGLGHVAIYKDGQVWSSPWHHKPTADVLSSIAEVERIYGVSYVGWSEDIGGTNVIQVAANIPLYTITQITPKQIQVLAGMNEWDLGNSDITNLENNPVKNSGAGLVFTAVATLKRSDGLSNFTYYLEDAASPIGWNTVDCIDYVAPVPVVDTVVPPKPQQSPPKAPITINYQTTPLHLVTKVPGYISSATSALTHSGSSVLLDYGNYLLYETAPNGMQYIGKSPGSLKYWINPADNVKPVPPAAPVIPSPTAADTSWKNTLTPLLISGKTIKFRILRDMYVHDMANPADKGIELNESTDDRSTWLPVRYWMVRSNMTYLVPFLSSDTKQEHFYAIPTTDIDSGLPNMESELYKADASSEREYRKQQGRETFDDRIYDINQAIGKLVKNGIRFMDFIKVKITKK